MGAASSQSCTRSQSRWAASSARFQAKVPMLYRDGLDITQGKAFSTTDRA